MIMLVGFGFTRTGWPSLITGSRGTFPSHNIILMEPPANEVIIYLNSVSSEDYAKIAVTDATTLDVSDFSQLSYSH